MNQRITELTQLVTPAPTDIIPIVDVSDPTHNVSGTTKYIKISNLGTNHTGVTILDLARDWTMPYPVRSDLEITYSSLTTGVGEDVTDSLVHPSVVYFPDGWNGYEYWMAITPYPVGAVGAVTAEKCENPSILCSSDGSNWTEAGTNPKCPIPVGYVVQGDPNIFYVESEDILVMHYARSDGTTREMCRSESSDGSTWTSPVVIFSSSSSAMGSPSMVKFGSVYRLYYTDFGSGANLKIRESADFRAFGSATPSNATLNGKGSKVIWDNHIYYWPDIAGGTWFGSICLADSTGGTNAQLYFGISSDGTTWDLRKVMTQDHKDWPNYLVYTTAVVPVVAADGSITLRAWVSGTNTTLNWGFGETTATPHGTSPHSHLPEHIVGVTPGDTGKYLDSGGVFQENLTPSSVTFTSSSGSSSLGKLTIHGVGTTTSGGAVISIIHDDDSSGAKQAGLLTRTRMSSRYLQQLTNIGQNDPSFGGAGLITHAALEYTNNSYSTLAAPTEFLGWRWMYYNGSGYSTVLQMRKDGVFLGNVSSPPATPTGGGVLYVESGALKYKGSSGTVSTIAPA